MMIMFLCCAAMSQAQVARLGIVSGHTVTDAPSRARIIVGQPLVGDVAGTGKARFGFLPLATSYPVSVQSATVDQVRVYPNPARDHVRLLHRVVQLASWTLVDGMGRFVAHGSIAPDALYTDISTVDLASGTYTIRCMGPATSSSWLVVVVR